MPSERKIIMIAGPNGAGKTTFALEYLPYEPACPIFVNADLIAAGVSPLAPETAGFRAGRLMLEEIDRHGNQGRSLAFETTLAGLAWVRRIRHWRSQGHVVKLIYLPLATPEEALRRVQQRVRQGGHGIPEAVIRRRFDRSVANFRHVYREIVDSWLVVDRRSRRLVLGEEGANRVKAAEGRLPAMQLEDPDMQAVPAAMERAVRRAHWDAHRHGTAVLVVENGKMVETNPDPALYEDLPMAKA